MFQKFPDIVLFCDMLAARGKIVIVASLDGTFERKPFGNILNLISIVFVSIVICYLKKIITRPILLRNYVLFALFAAKYLLFY